MTTTNDAIGGGDWWQGAVLYQVYPRSFRDMNGDGVGDIAGIEAGLDHIASLGVDGFWISPVFRSPGRDFGYDVSSYREIDPMFGTVEDVERLIQAAHARGLKIMLDLVPSHTSDQHAWFVESRSDRTNPKADWYLWRDAKHDGTPPNNWQSEFSGPAWTWHAGRQQYYYHRFLAEQPSLNYENPDVISTICGELRFWLERGVDGFRLDAVQAAARDPDLRDNPPKSSAEMTGRGPTYPSTPSQFQDHLFDLDTPNLRPLLAALRELADAFPGTMMMAEVGGTPDEAATSARVSGPGLLHTAYNFDLTRRTFDHGAVLNIVRHTLATMGDRWMTWTVGNHDVTRVATRWAEGVSTERRADFVFVILAWLMSLRGLVSLYQGDELGLTQAAVPYEKMQDPVGLRLYPADHGRDGCRVPIPWEADAPAYGFSEAEPWLPTADDYADLSIDRQTDNPASLMRRLAAFMAWKRERPVLRQGSAALLELPAPLYGLVRELNGARMVGLFNTGAEAVPVELPEGNWRRVKTPFDLGGEMDESSTVLVPPYGVTFFEAMR